MQFYCDLLLSLIVSQLMCHSEVEELILRHFILGCN